MLYDRRTKALLQQLHVVDKAINAAIAARSAHLAAGSRISPTIADKLQQLNRRRDIILTELEDIRSGSISDRGVGQSARTHPGTPYDGAAE